MNQITAIAWPAAHAIGGGGWHWADVLSALLTFVAVVGLTLYARGRRTRVSLSHGRDSRAITAKPETAAIPTGYRLARPSRPAASSKPGVRT